MRVLNFFLAGLAAVFLAGCASYHLGPVNGAVAGDKTVEVLPFNNLTLQPRLGDAVTQALRERLQVDGTYRLATRDPALTTARVWAISTMMSPPRKIIGSTSLRMS